MADIAVNIASLNQSCENNLQHTKELMKQKELLDSVANDLSSKWEGISSQTYFGRFSVKQQRLEVIISGMQDVVNYEAKAVKIYSDANRIVSEMIDAMF